MRLTFITIALLASACSTQTHIEKTIEDPNGPRWLEDSIYDAAEFWQMNEDVDILVGETGEVQVEVKQLLPDYLGLFAGDGVGGGTISMTPELGQNFEQQSANCVMRHEQGHALGMEHVDDPNSLMFPVLHLPADGNDCFWSDADVAEFCAATGHDCNGQSSHALVEGDAADEGVVID